MKRAPGLILDASALVALVSDEPGADVVRREVERREYAAITAVNYHECLTVLLAARGGTLRKIAETIRETRGADRIRTIDFTIAMAVEFSRVKAALRPYGQINLSHGDMAALAAARATDLPLLTSDAEVTFVDLGPKVIDFRPWEENRRSRPAGLPRKIVPTV